MDRASPFGVVGLRGTRRGESMRIVMRDVAALQLLLAAMFFVPLAASLAYGETYSAASFLISAAIAATFGGLVYRSCRNAGEPTRQHAMLIAAMGWLVSAGIGALPFVLAAYLTPPAVAQEFVPVGETYASSLFYFKNPLHAFFESMSGFTTTGLTMSVHEPSIGRGLLFYRSITQWVGGAGVIVLSLAIVPRPHTAGVLELYQSESAGMKIRPSILGTARAIWKVYSVLTLLVVVYLAMASALFVPEIGLGDALFHAVNHAMTGLATGGFSTFDESISGYESYAMELIHLLPMILGAISLPLYYMFLQSRHVRVFWRDPQFRLMSALIAGGVPLSVLLLWPHRNSLDPVREGSFQFVSALSGTGWQTTDISNWGAPAILVLACGAMVVSGSAGSTVGGIKLIRGYLILRSIAWQVRKVLMPANAVIPFRIGEQHLTRDVMQREVSEAAVFSLLYTFILGASVIIAASLTGPEFELADVIFECASAQGTVGLSAGITGPDMPIALELLFILQMWIGRLEIFPVIILVSTLISRNERH